MHKFTSAALLVSEPPFFFRPEQPECSWYRYMNACACIIRKQSVRFHGSSYSPLLCSCHKCRVGDHAARSRRSFPRVKLRIGCGKDNARLATSWAKLSFKTFCNCCKGKEELPSLPAHLWVRMSSPCERFRCGHGSGSAKDGTSKSKPCIKHWFLRRWRRKFKGFVSGRMQRVYIKTLRTQLSVSNRLSAFLSVIKRFIFWNSNEIQKSNKKHHCFRFWMDAVARSVKFVYPVVSSNSIHLLLLFAPSSS